MPGRCNLVGPVGFEPTTNGLRGDSELRANPSNQGYATHAERNQESINLVKLVGEHCVATFSLRSSFGQTEELALCV